MPEDLPSLLLPRKGRYGLIDYEKAFTPEWTTGADDIFDLRGIDREHGALCKAVFNRPKDWVDIDAMMDADTALDAAEVLRWVGRIAGDDDPRYGRIAAVLTHRKRAGPSGRLTGQAGDRAPPTLPRVRTSVES